MEELPSVCLMMSSLSPVSDASLTGWAAQAASAPCSSGICNAAAAGGHEI